MKNAPLFVGALLSWAAAAPADAALTVYRDKAAYIAATGTPGETITFNGGSGQEETLPGNSFSSSVTFDLCGKPGPTCFGPPYPSGLVVRQGDALEYKPYATAVMQIAGAFTVPPPYNPVFEHAIAFDITGNTSNVQFFLAQSLTGFLDSVELTSQTGFFGIVSTDGFDNFSWTKYAYNPDYEATFFIDTVYLAAAVPEPASAMLLIGGLAWLRSRRRPA